MYYPPADNREYLRMTWLRKLSAKAAAKKYQLRHWFFKWNADSDDGGSIVFTVCNRLHFLKYKEHTIMYFGPPKKFGFTPATNHVKANG